MEHARRISERSLPDLMRLGIEARASGLVLLRCREGLRHGVWIDSGYVVGVHVAGRHDPLLELLLRAGLIDLDHHRRALEALYGTTARSGELATSLLGVPASAVRETLKQQVSARFVALLELAKSAGYDARLEPGEVPTSERCMRMPLGSLLRHAERELPRTDSAPEHGSEARRALRSLAKALHPDCHPHLDAAARARLSEQLARATAAYHGFHKANTSH